MSKHFGADLTEHACRIMSCETGGTFDPTIKNPHSSASGLFQFLRSTWHSWRASVGSDVDEARFATPEQQVEAAANLQRESGWTPWVCR